MWYCVFETYLGWVAALASHRGIRATSPPLNTPQQAVDRLGPTGRIAEYDPSRLETVIHLLAEALIGPVAVSLERLDLEGVGSFYRASWLACQSIPRGATRSYTWLASQAGNSQGARAAGQAMARNRFPLLVPCHRVISASGKIGGYSGGSGLKARLLAAEQEMEGRVPRVAKVEIHPEPIY